MLSLSKQAIQTPICRSWFCVHVYMLRSHSISFEVCHGDFFTKCWKMSQHANHAQRLQSVTGYANCFKQSFTKCHHCTHAQSPGCMSRVIQHPHRLLHGEGLPGKVPQALLCDRLEVGRLIFIWGVFMVCQLHEQIPLHHRHDSVTCILS